MFKKILLAIDGSDASQKAIDWAKNTYDKLPNAEFTILHVHQPYYVTVPEAMAYVPEAAAGVVEALPTPTIAADAYQQFRDQERVSYQSLTGNPAAIICAEAKTGGYDVIVLGSEGHGVVSTVLLGSCSAKVLHHAPCSVLIVR